jgi:hypothetical protein
MLPPVTPRDDAAAQQHAYSFVRAAVLPLALVVASLALPVLGVKSTPMPWLSLVPDSLLWLIPWPVYGEAALLALVIGLAVYRKTVPGENARGAVLFGLVSSVIWALPYAGFLAFAAAGSGAWLLAPLPFVPVGAAVWAFVRENRQRGWVRWGYLLLSYACSTLPLVALFVGAMSAGAYGAVLAIVALGLVLYLAVRAVRPPSTDG